MQSHFLPLDEGESFGTSLLSLHVRETPRQLPTPPPSPESSRSATPRISSSPRSGWAGPPAPFERSTTRTVVGSGPARLFRHWFEDSVHHSNGRLQPRTLEPSGATALLCAQLLCHQVDPIIPHPRSRTYFSPAQATHASQYLNSSPPRMFEYHIERIKVDVGKFCAALEEASGREEFLIKWTVD
ncbi:hypothetical protein OIV83_000813 [Microbotryomycetes sp. JL201]|nr:hypothetical protein OIV83_000813 [Microbotryomycetes sp. JL201]